MSSEKWSGGDEAGKSEGLDFEPKTKKKKNRKLSWQETPRNYDSNKVLPKEEVIKLECTLEKEPTKESQGQGSVSDGEVAANSRKMLRRGRKLSRGNRSSASFRSSHRRVKSLIRFEMSDYTLSDIRQIHEEIENRPMKPFAAKVAFFKDFTRNQKLILACLCLVDFTSFCSASIMAPFFPKKAQEKGMSEVTSGFAFSFYALVIFISSPFFGKILPKVGGRYLFLSGLFVTSNSDLLFGLLEYIRDDWDFAVFCFVIQAFRALGCSAFSTASYVFVAEVFPSNISAVLGVLETFVGLGLSVGPAIGGFLYHIGGFGLPFYGLGVVLLLTFPVAFYVLPTIEGSSVQKSTGSFLDIMTEPCVIINGLVIVITSIVWSFMDPTLEPHLRQFNLTPANIGLIFLLFSALYGISSPIFGLILDRTNNHWVMMTTGLFISTFALLLLGPAPFIPFLHSDLRTDLAALTILGASMALSLLPTFEGLLSAVSSVKGNPENNITTYSIVAGLWSSLYALGEVIGPFSGGILTANYGFPICCTIVAGATFTLAIGSAIYFIIRDCLIDRGENYRYKFEESDGYDSDRSCPSEDPNRPLLRSSYTQNRLYTEEDSI